MERGSNIPPVLGLLNSRKGRVEPRDGEFIGLLVWVAGPHAVYLDIPNRTASEEVARRTCEVDAGSGLG